MPYSHHHADSNVPISAPEGFKTVWIGSETLVSVSFDSIRNESRYNAPVIAHNRRDEFADPETFMPLVGRLSSLPDEILVEVLTKRLSGASIDWDSYQRELDWHDRIEGFKEDFDGTVEVEGALWGWTNGYIKRLGCIPLDREADWEISIEDGYTFSDIGLVLPIDPTSERETVLLGQKIKDRFYPEEEQ